ncbi:MAG: type IX secretion system membrane protein PorP/SprF [Bacteroidota bacterium]
MKNSIYITICLLLFRVVLTGQNQFNLSQYMLYKAFVNPAAIGSYDKVNGAIYNRSQWVGFDGAPVSQGFNVNLPFKSAKHTIGLAYLHDKIGANNNNEISLGYSFKARLTSKTSLLLGLMATANILKTNYTALALNDAVDPTFSSNTTAVLPNFKYGMYLQNDKYYVGIAVPNLMENKITSGKGNVSFNAKNLHFYLQGGYLFTLGSKSELGVSTLIKQVSGSPLQADLNVQYIYSRRLGIGASYRTSNDLVGLVNFQITPMFKLGYSYDYALSALRKYNSGSHEVMLIFNMVNDKKTIGAQIPSF